MPVQKKKKVNLFKVRAHFTMWVVIADEVMVNTEVCIIVREKRVLKYSAIFFNKYGQIVFPAKKKMGIPVYKTGKPVIPEWTYDACNIQARIGTWFAN